MSNKLLLGCLVAIFANAANWAECKDPITFQAHDDGVKLNLAISPDGKTLATIGGTKSITLWNAGSLERITSLDGHEAAIIIVKFSPNGQLLVSASADGSVRFWHAETRKQLNRIALPGAVTDASFSPDGKRLAVAVAEETRIHIINVANGQVESVLAVPEAKKIDGSNATACAEFSPDGKFLVAAVGGRGWPDFVGDDSVLAIWDAKTMRLHASFVADRHNISDLAISPDSKTIATACHRSRVIKLWKLDIPSSREADAVVIEGLIAQLDDDVFAKREDAQNQLRKIGPAAAKSLRKAVGSTKSLELRKRGSIILASFTHIPITVLPGTGFDVHTVAFSPDGKLLASGRQSARPGHLVIWDLSNANRRVTAPNRTGAWCVAFFPDGGTLASGSRSGQVTLWDVKSLFAQ